ncbi:MAG: phenylacetic acid degradation bifunctional protein PaaZ [Bacteroidetes bacterium]|nr:phenylacetic acid degradation bifunctional protein PaaZ [Bacteroidota bacterium]MBK9523420.1 phenylacetic acid degradation bifunctional protein PaaZ [Bacteroidota bacterium]MBK9541164.1 phenylacetic acid degradation bifunctional protein PaaZ [Bacteroidota bacterium]MBP6402972.1 phenylacetic acid degradation bifunctional protein PaaZ [Bacteroidia bacterium]
MLTKLKSYSQGKWQEGSGSGTVLLHAVTGEALFSSSSDGIDFKGMLEYGRKNGGPKLRKMTFHERARMLKALALFLTDKKKELYALSAATGATKTDSWIDIDGGIGNLFVYASKGRRELPDETFYVDGGMEMISKTGTFVGHHICVPLEGVALHINAFNFPVWGMLEKIAVNLLAGVPAIVKPATSTSFLTELAVQQIISSGILPEGSLQLICGSTGNLFDHLTCQDAVTFTGSAQTGRMLKSHPSILENSIRFNMEADSLNCSILGPDASPDTEEFKLFIKEVVREMTVKAGQKCTAIRRTIVPESLTEPVLQAIKEKLKGNIIGDPAVEGVRMGPLASKGQVKDVKDNVRRLMKSCEVVYGDIDSVDVVGADTEKGAFMSSMLLYCKDALKHSEPHTIEAFGPVNTVMSYRNADEAAELAKMGKGSLVGSVFTSDDSFAKEIVMGSASMHGRMVIINKNCAAESTGHGSPLAHLVHGGPGRAGGGEEMGGIRGVHHYMQRTALQGSPTTLTKILNTYLPGAETKEDIIHPFRKYFDEILVGDSLLTHRRTVTEADIVNFAGVSGDYFYAHTDETSLEGSIFEKRVAHGYFIISAAAGLFVDPKKGPVLANYGLDNLRFTQPVYVGDTIQVKLTCQRKTKKDDREGQIPQGVVEWYVQVTNQRGETVALETVLTLVACKN